MAAELTLRLRVAGNQDVQAALSSLGQQATNVSAKVATVNTAQARMGESAGTAGRAMSNLTMTLGGVSAIASILARNNPELQEQFQRLSIGASAFGASIRAVGGALRLAMLNPVGLAITALVALGAAAFFVIKHFEQVREHTLRIWGGIKDFFVRVFEGLRNLFLGFGTVLANLFDPEKRQAGIEQMRQGLGQLKDVAVDLGQGVKAFAVTAFEQFNNLLGDTKSKADKAKEAVERLIRELDKISQQESFAERGRTRAEAPAKFAQVLDQQVQELIAQANDVAAAVGPEIAMSMLDRAIPGFEAFGEAGNAAILKILQAAAELGKQIHDDIPAAFQRAATEAQTAADQMAKAFLGALASGQDAFQALGNTAKRIFIEIVTEASGLNKMLKDFFTNLLTPAGGGFNLFGLLPFFFLQHGGIVTKPTLAMVGEAGPEAVIPLNRAPQLAPAMAGGRTIVLNFTHNGALMGNAMEARQFARLLMEQIRHESGRR